MSEVEAVLTELPQTPSEVLVVVIEPMAVLLVAAVGWRGPTEAVAIDDRSGEQGPEEVTEVAVDVAADVVEVVVVVVKVVVVVVANVVAVVSVVVAVVVDVAVSANDFVSLVFPSDVWPSPASRPPSNRCDHPSPAGKVCRADS